MSKTIYLKSQQPALIEINNSQYILENSEQYHIVNLQQDTLVKYYPISHNTCATSLPKVIKLTMTRLNNKDLVVTQFSNNVYEVVIKPTLVCHAISNEETQLVINNTEYTIKLYSSYHSHITIVSQTDTFVHEVDFELTNLTAITKNNYIIIQANCKDKVYLLIVDTDYIIQEEKLYNSLELNDMLLKGFLEQEDMAKHGIIVSYNLSTKPYTVTQEVVYINNSPTITKNELLLPYAFLEAVKVKNYKLAKHYLSKQLSNKLSEQHLYSFFGDFVDIRQNIFTNKNYPVALIYGKNNNLHAQLYAFEIQNNKINNIIQA